MAGKGTGPSFALPALLSKRGLVMRSETPDDRPFLERLYTAVRWSELDVTNWPEEGKGAFLRQQFDCQFRHYALHYAGAAFLILEQAGEAVGRFYLHRGPHDFRVVDIALMPQARNAGIGTALFEALFAEAAVLGRTVSIHVETINPAQTLYRRLGFKVAGESGPYLLMEWRPPGHPPPKETA